VHPRLLESRLYSAGRPSWPLLTPVFAVDVSQSAIRLPRVLSEQLSRRRDASHFVTPSAALLSVYARRGPRTCWGTP